MAHNFLCLVLVAVVLREISCDNPYKNATDAIDKTGQVIGSMKKLVGESNKDGEAALTVIKNIGELGAVFFPQMAVFASFFGLIGAILGGVGGDDAVINELKEIKDHLKDIEFMINKLVPEIELKMIVQRFIDSYHEPVIGLRRMYEDMVDIRSLPQKQQFMDQCRNNDMKIIMTNLHDQIVNRPNMEGSIFKLFDRPNRELGRAQTWSKIFHAMYIQASFLNTICYKLLYPDPSFEAGFNRSLKKEQDDFVALNNAFLTKFEDLRANARENAKTGLEGFFVANKAMEGHSLTVAMSNYLNSEYKPAGKEWTVVLAQATIINRWDVNKAVVIERNDMTVLAEYDYVCRLKANEDIWKAWWEVKFFTGAMFTLTRSYKNPGIVWEHDSGYNIGRC